MKWKKWKGAYKNDTSGSVERIMLINSPSSLNRWLVSMSPISQQYCKTGMQRVAVLILDRGKAYSSNTCRISNKAESSHAR